MRVVLDTNVIVSGLVSTGNCREIIEMIKSKQFEAISSPILLIELEDVLVRKMKYSVEAARLTLLGIRRHLSLIQPEISLTILNDEPDNRVLEVAVAGKCGCIITGDKDFLKLESYQSIAILAPSEFLNRFHDRHKTNSRKS